jgi:hypothetical protein
VSLTSQGRLYSREPLDSVEACGGAHHWARLLQSKGYLVKLIAPQFVKPYVKSNKTDAKYGRSIRDLGSDSRCAISTRSGHTARHCCSR